MTILPFLMVLQSAASAPPVIPGTGGPVVTIPRIDADVSIDGSLDEAVWERAARLGGFSQYEPVDGRPAEERTEVRVWYAPDAIYFGIIADDSQPGSVRATHADRDNIDSDDHVTVYLDTFDDRRRAFFFSVNPLGVQQDGVRSEGAGTPGRLFAGNMDTNPDFIFQSRGRLTDQGYVVEVRIPFKSLRFPGNGPQHWGLNIERHVQRTGYTDTWTDVRRANASFLVQAGTIEGLHDLRRGVVVEAQPTFTAIANGSRAEGTGDFRRESVRKDVGGNVRLGFSNLAIDGTINPDFSQVETDQGQVTINERFTLFFPEKRPFFLEGIELFSTPNQLIYTRRIANPIGGAKLTGKFGSVGVAHLTAVDEGVDGAKDALFNITRLRRDFGSNSVMGLTYTDRSELDSDAFNRVLAGDVRVVFARLYFIETQLGRSWTRAEDGTIGSPLWKAEFDRTGRSWGFNYLVSGIGENFDAQAGFVPRSGIVSAHGMNRFSLYGSRGSFLEQFTAFFGPVFVWDYDGFGGHRPIEGKTNLNLSTRLRGGWQVNGNLSHAFVRFGPDDYAGYSTEDGASYLPLESVAGDSIGFNVHTPTFQLGDAGAGFGRARTAIFAEGSAGIAKSVSANINLRPTEWLRLFFTQTFRAIDRADDGSEFARAAIPRLKVEAQVARPLFFRLVGEYRSERQAALRDPRTGAPLLRDGEIAGATRTNGLRVDLLASFEPSPGTVAFFGYGSSLASDRTFDLAHLERSTDGFFIKLAYQFRR